MYIHVQLDVDPVAAALSSEVLAQLWCIHPGLPNSSGEKWGRVLMYWGLAWQDQGPLAVLDCRILQQDTVVACICFLISPWHLKADCYRELGLIVLGRRMVVKHSHFRQYDAWYGIFFLGGGSVVVFGFALGFDRKRRVGALCRS